MGLRINFEIERTHIEDTDMFGVTCTGTGCKLKHMWSVYERSLDKDGVGEAQWQSDHVDHARAEQAAFAYRAQLMYSLTANNTAMDTVREFFDGR